MMAEEGNYPVTMMARVLEVSLSGYYKYKHRIHRPPSPRQIRRQQLAQRIREIFEAHKGLYGVRRIQAQLRIDDEFGDVGLFQIRAIMHEQGLWGTQPRRKRITTIRAKDADARPDLIGWKFRPQTTTGPGQRCCGDITYLPTQRGFEYLATVIDIDTRQVIGFAQAEHMRAELVIEALMNAKKAGYLADGAIFHSDHGSVYTSEAFAKAARLINVRLSLGRVGVCWDNAVAESFFATLKREFYNHYRWDNRQQCRQRVEMWIRGYYNSFRIHSALGVPPRVRHRELLKAQDHEVGQPQTRLVA